MQPDVFVVAKELLLGKDVTGWSDIRWLLLAVEVLSPSTQRQDRVTKRDFYLASGVREYWIVDTDARVIERWTCDRTTPDLRRSELVWHPDGAARPFTLDVQAFFEEQVLLPPRA